MVTNVNVIETIAALLAGVLALLVVSVAPGLAWADVEESTASGARACVDVELDVFSGRPNPQWTTAADQIAPLLPGADARPLAAPAEPPGLGYRGFLLTISSAETGVPTVYRVYGREVSVGAGNERTSFVDEKGLEAWLLEDARRRGYADVLESKYVPPLSVATASGP
jgi:hypothetical protein